MQMSLGFGIQQMLIASSDYVFSISGFQFSQEGCSTGKSLTQVLYSCPSKENFTQASMLNVKKEVMS